MGRALITGASSGLGEQFAIQLAERGHNLVLVARRADRLEALARDLESAHGVEVEVLPADLADRDQLERVAQRVRSATSPVDLLVNNAGFGLGQNFLEDDLAREEQALAVMVRAVLVLSHAAGNTMRQRGHGAICNVSSIAADTTMGTYAAHKTWVNQFTQSLAEDLRGTGVRVVSLRPGTTRTEFWNTEGIEADEVPTIFMLEPERVVADALQALRGGPTVCVPSLPYKIIDVIVAKSPRSIVRRISSGIHRNRMKI
ncbi:MAG: SDR family oxidoreductase [Actinomycetaceae bacterium]|nr:SDR family oxidoreductase [Actinomycetaceae bacterium]MDU0969811.1 SDR family oxidoreductase [Actinomycetaceae bacterium]